MTRTNLENNPPARQASRTAAELRAIGQRSGFEHIGSIVDGIVQPLLVRRALEQALLSPAIVSVRIELRTAAVELAA